jgi:hypothetical protein
VDTVQVPGSLNISGTLSANIFNALTQYNIAGNRVLSSGGTNNIFAGNGAGQLNTSGQANAFFGALAGTANLGGSFNSFFGYNAGAANSSGINNAFFGQGAGFKNSTASNNTFLGNGAGLNNTNGAGNTFVGSLAGQGTSGGSSNTFMGVNAGTANVGNSNNTFVGANTANSVLTGSGNTYLGANADGAFLTSNSTALGINAYAGQSNSLILGGINGVNGATANTNVGIGTSTPQTILHVKDTTSSSVTIESSSTTGTGIVLSNPYFNNANWLLSVQGASIVAPLRLFEQVTGAEVFRLEGARGGQTRAQMRMYGDVNISDSLLVGVLPGNGSENVCRNNSGYLAACSSSLRYKTDLKPFTSGLALLDQLKPIIFRWKSDNKLDLGFGAEDVAKVEPLLVTHNGKGEIEGVKYDRISAVLVNAVKEQQVQIAAQQAQIEKLLASVSALQKTTARLVSSRRNARSRGNRARNAPRR